MGGADHALGPQVDEHRHLSERCVTPGLRLPIFLGKTHLGLLHSAALDRRIPPNRPSGCAASRAWLRVDRRRPSRFCACAPEQPRERRRDNRCILQPKSQTWHGNRARSHARNPSDRERQALPCLKTARHRRSERSIPFSCHHASCPKSPAPDPKAARCDPRPSSCARQESSRLRVADPPSSKHFVRSTNCENQKAKCLRRAAIGVGQLRHELRSFGVGQGGVVTRLTLRPLRKFFPKPLGQFGRIAKPIVVDVDILRDYRFDAPADAVRRLALLDPNRLEQFEM